MLPVLRIVSVVLLLAPDSPFVGKRYPLAASARISVREVEIDKAGSDAYMCRDFHLSEARIRARFRTYRRLGPRDEHDHYSWFPCHQRGTIAYQGKTFYFDANMANTMWTNWPDGEDKDLGGKHDGELSD